MILILAQINGVVRLDEKQTEDIRKFCDRKGINKLIKVTTAQTFIKVIEEFQNEEVIMFSNYPPNSSYPENRKTMGENGWKADSYSQSAELFKLIMDGKNFKSIDIITGAPFDVLSDEEVKATFSNNTVSITRLRDWDASNVPHHIQYKNLIQNRIRFLGNLK